MRRIALVVALGCVLRLSGCAAGDLLNSIFGARNSDQADLNRDNGRNQGAAMVSE
jgi:hypothetical protein